MDTQCAAEDYRQRVVIVSAVRLLRFDELGRRCQREIRFYVNRGGVEIPGMPGGRRRSGGSGAECSTRGQGIGHEHLMGQH
jgi:hypothetical protein